MVSASRLSWSRRTRSALARRICPASASMSCCSAARARGSVRVVRRCRCASIRRSRSATSSGLCSPAPACAERASASACSKAALSSTTRPVSQAVAWSVAASFSEIWSCTYIRASVLTISALLSGAVVPMATVRIRLLSEVRISSRRITSVTVASRIVRADGAGVSASGASPASANARPASARSDSGEGGRSARLNSGSATRSSRSTSRPTRSRDRSTSTWVLSTCSSRPSPGSTRPRSITRCSCGSSIRVTCVR